MRDESRKDRNNCRTRAAGSPGIVLLMTLVVLVVLSTLGYILSSRVVAQRHRDQYIIDYQAARYGCDSAIKYALATLEDIDPLLISRPNELDFSDLFALSEAEYEELLAEEAAKNAFDRSRNFYSISDINDVNYVGDVEYAGGVTDLNDADSLRIRGPYGPPWPFVTEPFEFEIGSATVSIAIEDENAKYPIGWALLDDKSVRREALAGFESFCEWMDINETQVDSLKSQLNEISKIKTFKLDFKPIKVTERRPIKRSIRARRGGRRRRRRRRRRSSRVRTITKALPATIHTADFTRLFHSSLIDTEFLARPTIISESKRESALKYMGMWASRKVNINTAPRHVLEAAFTFGGDYKEITEEIIQRRRIKPFTDIEDLRKALFRYSDSVGKCEKYITTVSGLFTIRVTAVSGVAKASAVIAITKDDKRIERIAVISGYN